MKRTILTLLLTLLLFTSFTSPAFAQGSGGDEFVFGGNRILDEGEIVDGDLVVFGGNVEIPESSKVNGDLVVVGGNATVHGTIDGDVGVLGGNVRLTDTAVVNGDVNSFGGHIDQSEEADVSGQVEDLNKFGSDDDGGHGGFVVPPVPGASRDSGASLWFGRIATIFEEITWSIGTLIGLALVGWLVAAFLPEQMQTVGDTVVQTPLVSFGMGLLTAALAAVLSIPLALLVLTICLAIIPVAVYILLGIAVLLGWVVIGQLIGERLLTSTERPLPSFVLSTVLGVVVLTVISNMPVVGIIPIIGPVFSFIGAIFGLLVALTGLGAVVLTRYGTRPYSSTSSSSSFGGGSTTYKPYNPASPSGSYDRLSAAEAELKAKIKAALAEADQAEADQKKDEPEPETPGDEPPSEDKPKPKKRPSAKKPKSGEDTHDEKTSDDDDEPPELKQ